MIFKKIKKLVGFFTGKNRRNRLKKELRKELMLDVERQLQKRLKAQRKKERAQRRKERTSKRVIRGLEGNFLHFENERLFNGTIKFLDGAQGNVIRFHEGSSFEGTIKVKGSNNLIEFGPHSKIRGTLSVGGKDRRLTFGDHSTGLGLFLVASGEDIHIGKWCMMSRNVEIRSTDAHGVVDRESRRSLNLQAPVFIGDHVWICAGVTIMKGSRIPSDSIVGAMSLVNRAFEEEGVVLAGIPAKVVKRGITWHRHIREVFTEEELDYRRYNAKLERIPHEPQLTDDATQNTNAMNLPIKEPNLLP